MASRSEPKDGRGSAAGSIDAPPVDPPSTPDKLGVVQLAVGFCVALGAMLAFALIAINITNQEAVALDTFANPFLHSIASPVLDGVMNAITSLGSGRSWGSCSCSWPARSWFRGHRAEALFLAVAIGGSVALNGTLKVVVERPRPVLPWAHVLPDYSFPSGHTMNSLVFYLAIALIVWATYGRRPGAPAVVLALVIAVAIGFSRIYLGYHYLSDVVAGLAAGIAWLLVVALAFETIPRSWAAAGQRASCHRDPRSIEPTRERGPIGRRPTGERSTGAGPAHLGVAGDQAGPDPPGAAVGRGGRRGDRDRGDGLADAGRPRGGGR